MRQSICRMKKGDTSKCRPPGVGPVGPSAVPALPSSQRIKSRSSDRGELIPFISSGTVDHLPGVADFASGWSAFSRIRTGTSHRSLGRRTNGESFEKPPGKSHVVIDGAWAGQIGELTFKLVDPSMANSRSQNPIRSGTILTPGIGRCDLHDEVKLLQSITFRPCLRTPPDRARSSVPTVASATRASSLNASTSRSAAGRAAVPVVGRQCRGFGFVSSGLPSGMFGVWIIRRSMRRGPRGPGRVRPPAMSAFAWPRATWAASAQPLPISAAAACRSWLGARSERHGLTRPSTAR